MFSWPIVPICENQRRDVYDGDLLLNGVYRLCRFEQSKVRDDFRMIHVNRFGVDPGDVKFIVQLRG